MGRIRTKYIKRSARELIEKFGVQTFSKSFEENKKKLTELAMIPSKQIRNKIAGYVTFLVKKSEEV